MIMEKPTCHRFSRIKVGLDHAGSFSQPGCGRCKKLRKALTIPNCGLKIHTHRIEATRGDITAGKKQRVRQRAIPLILVLSSMATMKAKAVAAGTPITVKYRVLPTADCRK